MSMLDMLQKQLGGDAVNQISRQLGTDPATTQTAIAAALPMLVGALARNAQDPSKAGALANALGRHDGSVLDDVAGYLGRGGDTGDGDGILGHVLGARQETVQTGLGQAAGIDPSKAGMLLSMLAPLVMGALGKAQREKGLDTGGLAGMLGGEQQRAHGRGAGRDGDAGIVARPRPRRVGDGRHRGMLGKLGK